MLYKVTITFDMFVESDIEHEDAVYEIVRENAPDELNNLVDMPDFQYDIEEVADISQVPNEWRQALPWGGDGETDIETLLNS